MPIRLPIHSTPNSIVTHDPGWTWILAHNWIPPHNNKYCCPSQSRTQLWHPRVPSPTHVHWVQWSRWNGFICATYWATSIPACIGRWTLSGSDYRIPRATLMRVPSWWHPSSIVLVNPPNPPMLSSPKVPDAQWIIPSRITSTLGNDSLGSHWSSPHRHRMIQEIQWISCLLPRSVQPPIGNTIRSHPVWWTPVYSFCWLPTCPSYQWGWFWQRLQQLSMLNTRNSF